MTESATLLLGTLAIGEGIILANLSFRYAKLRMENWKMKTDAARFENARYTESLEERRNAFWVMDHKMSQALYNLQIENGALKGQIAEKDLKIQALDDYIQRYQGGFGSAKSINAASGKIPSVAPAVSPISSYTAPAADRVTAQECWEEKTDMDLEPYTIDIPDTIITIDNPMTGQSTMIDGETGKFKSSDGISKERKQIMCYYMWRKKVDEFFEQNGVKPGKLDADLMREEISQEFMESGIEVKVSTVKTYVSNYQKQIKNIDVTLTDESGATVKAKGIDVDCYGRCKKHPGYILRGGYIGSGYDVEDREDGQKWIIIGALP